MTSSSLIRHCPALLISAPASGQGKTTVTAALAWHFRQQGRKVRVFKTGPDFIDPQILAHASGQPVYQLDLWMMGEAHCKDLLYRAAFDAEVILIEGVMGLYDGDSSSADLAQALSVPVATVIDAHAMAQTFAAVAFGLAHYREGFCRSPVSSPTRWPVWGMGNGWPKPCPRICPCSPRWRRMLRLTCRRGIWGCCRPQKSMTSIAV